jgi:hypothetical protein
LHELLNKIGGGNVKPNKDLNNQVGVDEIDGEQVEVKSEDGEPGIRKARKMHDPNLPSEQEVNEHYTKGHFPYRSCHHHCVRGRGREPGE